MQEGAVYDGRPFSLNQKSMTALYVSAVITCFIIIVTAAFANWGANPGKPKTVATPPPPKAKHPKFKMTVRLTMRTLIRWEQLRAKSFSLMDYSNDEDMEALLYCSVLCCNPGMDCTLEEFKHTMQNDKLVRQMAQALTRESTVMGQFRQEQEGGAGQETNAEPGFIKDIISTLIMAGLDIGFVMDEMQLCDLPLFITAYENKRKEQMESDRLWTYLNILPHVDGKKLSSARELYPFPWEMEEMKAQANKAIQEDAEKLEMFFNQGKNLIDQNYG